MSNSACETELLEHLVQRWAARISLTSRADLDALLTRTEHVVAAVKDLRPHGKKARRMLQAQARLSQPMMSMLEVIGRHAALFRLKAKNLPASISSLYALTQLPFRQFTRAIETDLRGLSRSEIRQLFSPAMPTSVTRRFMTIAIPTAVADPVRLKLIADVTAALGRIGEAHGVELAISPRPPAVKRKSRTTPRKIPVRRMDNSLLGTLSR